MRPKSLILLVLALGCGLIAAVGINQILARPTTEVQTVGIVVAKREIRKGDMIKPDDIRLQEWHVDSMPEGAIQKIEDLAERRVKTNIVPGEAILMSKLVGKGINDSVENIPSGMKGVAVKVDKVSSGGGLILPGDNVDVLLHVEANPSKGIPSTATKVLLKNIKVHAVDDQMERPAPGEASIAAQTLTLVVTPKQATILAHATEIGNIRFVLRSATDHNSDDEADTSVTTSQVLNGMQTELAGGDAPSIPGITPLPPVEPAAGGDMQKGFNGLTDFLEKMKDARDLGPAEPKEQPWKMIMIEGTQTKELEFTKDSRFGRVTSSGGDEPALPPSPLEPTLPELPPVEEATDEK